MEGMGSLTGLETDVEEVAVVKTVKEEQKTLRSSDSWSSSC
jgi:hypothetical protein